MAAAIIAFIAFIVLFTLLFKVGTKTMGKYVATYVSRRHQVAETLLETRRIPPEWREDLLKGTTGPDDPGAQNRIRRRLDRRLNRLAKYFQNTPLVDSEQTRTTLLDQLVDIAEDWEKAPIGQLFD